MTNEMAISAAESARCDCSWNYAQINLYVTAPNINVISSEERQSTKRPAKRKAGPALLTQEEREDIVNWPNRGTHQLHSFCISVISYLCRIYVRFGFLYVCQKQSYCDLFFLQLKRSPPPPPHSSAHRLLYWVRRSPPPPRPHLADAVRRWQLLESIKTYFGQIYSIFTCIYTALRKFSDKAVFQW